MRTPPGILVTGPPGVGKTTFARRVLELLPEVRATGFYTEELRGRAGRTGFRLVTLDGRTAQPRDGERGGGPRVGRYGVHVDALDAIGADAVEPRPGVDLIVIDEIGKMECMAAAFVRAARRALTGPVPVLGSVALIGAGFIAEAKRLPGMEVIHLTLHDRDGPVAPVAERIRAAWAGFGADRRGSSGLPEAPQDVRVWAISAGVACWRIAF